MSSVSKPRVRHNRHKQGLNLTLEKLSADFRIEKMLERQNKMKECLDGDTLLDNYDLSKLLGVTHRTLARYRQKKLIRYYMIDGRTYYKASEINDFLKMKGAL